MPVRQRKLTLELSEAQSQVYQNPARFRVLVAGRRFGKTQLAFIELLRAAWQAPARSAWYVAPSYRQAKRIAWKRLKDLVSGCPGAKASETELTVQLANNSTIALRGADNYDGLRGNGLDFVVLDEFASMKPEVWTDVLRPALADRKGRALFIGTPQGHNHLYDRFQFAQAARCGVNGKTNSTDLAAPRESVVRELSGEFAREAALAERTSRPRAPLEPANEEAVGPHGASLLCASNVKPHPDWAAFHFTTLDGGFVTEEELAGAARELDHRLFRQEFEASFENTALGRAYHAFSRIENVLPWEYRPGSTLIWSLDFNVHPMCSIIAQVDGNTVYVLDELILEDANTPLACERFWSLAAQWLNSSGRLLINVYGDASGHQRRTCGTASDWTIIRDFFAQRSHQATVHIKASTSNPGVRDRVNLVNARLLNAAGDRHLYIDPKCKELILDLERVFWRAGEFGQPTSELDKSDRKRTHVSDALGYYLAQAFPFHSKIGEKRGRIV
jgi:hypothetical protein